MTSVAGRSRTDVNTLIPAACVLTAEPDSNGYSPDRTRADSVTLPISRLGRAATPLDDRAKSTDHEVGDRYSGPSPVDHNMPMVQQEAPSEMEAWTSADFRQWIATLTEETAPRSINWWLGARWVAQHHVYDRTLTAEARRGWADVALLLTQNAERFAGYERWSAATDEVNVRSLLIHELGPVPGDDKWDPAVLARDVLAIVTLAPQEAHELAAQWRALPREQVLLLRRHKNLLAPLVSVVDQLPAGPDAEHVQRWLEVRPNLP
jgi:hypothetical protein